MLINEPFLHDQSTRFVSVYNMSLYWYNQKVVYIVKSTGNQREISYVKDSSTKLTVSASQLTKFRLINNFRKCYECFYHKFDALKRAVLTWQQTNTPKAAFFLRNHFNRVFGFLRLIHSFLLDKELIEEQNQEDYDVDLLLVNQCFIDIYHVFKITTHQFDLEDWSNSEALLQDKLQAILAQIKTLPWTIPVELTEEHKWITEEVKRKEECKQN